MGALLRLLRTHVAAKTPTATGAAEFAPGDTAGRSKYARLTVESASKLHPLLPCPSACPSSVSLLWIAAMGYAPHLGQEHSLSTASMIQFCFFSVTSSSVISFALPVVKAQRKLP